MGRREGGRGWGGGKGVEDKHTTSIEYKFFSLYV